VNEIFLTNSLAQNIDPTMAASVDVITLPRRYASTLDKNTERKGRQWGPCGRLGDKRAANGQSWR
jgi:hypothetical protein